MKTLVAALCCTLPLFAAYSTYFEYSKEEIDDLKELTASTRTMDNQELQKWDGISAKALATSDLPYFERQRVTTYLYVAQAEAAAVSHIASDRFAGTLDPVSDKVLQLLLSNYSSDTTTNHDPYSDAVASLVMAHIQARVEKEDQREDRFKVPEEDSETYTVGLEVARWIPWHLDDPKGYWPSPPPPANSRAWDKQVSQIKEAQSEMNHEMRDGIYRWAGRQGPYTGNWVSITNHYLFSRNIPFAKAVRVRAALLTGLDDSAITFFSAKYHYRVPRPKAYDESVDYEIEVPAHPSYPSGHSTEAGAARTILTHYFPHNAQEWDAFAEESCRSRIWGGIHYPVDDWAGRKSGEKIGRQVVRDDPYER